ncbi:MAG: monooxygenase [Rhodospirillaceae bacterium]|nr:monooxygenase [Rhodospirillaceae bacterium]
MSHINTAKKQNNIIIVGAGPVGLVVALRLTQNGIPVTILEESSAPIAEPRASTFHPPTLDMLDTLGLSQSLLSLGRIAEKWQYSIFETGENAVFDLGVLKDETKHPYRLQCEQVHLVRAAAKELNRLAPKALIYNAKVTKIGENSVGPWVDADINGTKERFNGRWLVGADGSNSIVRRELGLTFTGQTYPAASIAIGTTFPFEKYIPNICGVNYFWAEGWSFSMFQTKKLWRVGYSLPKGMSDSLATSSDEIQNKLRKIYPSKTPFRLETARVYRVHRRTVDTFRVKSILLTGDAAHLNSPSGGMGMNSGIHDAFNLTDKLISIFKNRADEGILDQYSRQRRFAATADIQRASDQNHKLHREQDYKARLKTLHTMQNIANDSQKLLDFVRESSLINSIKRANLIN